MIELSSLIAEILGSGSISIAAISLISCIYLAKKLTPKNRTKN
jgi:hypothetical protein